MTCDDKCASWDLQGADGECEGDLSQGSPLRFPDALLSRGGIAAHAARDPLRRFCARDWKLCFRAGASVCSAPGFASRRGCCRRRFSSTSAPEASPAIGSRGWTAKLQAVGDALGLPHPRPRATRHAARGCGHNVLMRRRHRPHAREAVRNPADRWPLFKRGLETAEVNLPVSIPLSPPLRRSR